MVFQRSNGYFFDRCAHLSKKYPFDLWNTILKPLIAESRVSAHFDDSLWIDVGTEDRLKLARKVLKDEN